MEYLEVLTDKQVRELKKRMTKEKSQWIMESYENEVKDLIEVTFPEKDDFLKIRETLTRNYRLHVKNKNYIRLLSYTNVGSIQTHFKELFILDGKPSNLDENDIGRRNTIITFYKWNLLKVVNPDSIKEPTTTFTD